VDGRLQLGVEVEQQVNIQGTLNMRSGIIQWIFREYSVNIAQTPRY
jgi:hypothetical protein